MIPRAANIHISSQLPQRVRQRLVEASFVEWPEKAIGESLARKVAIDDAIRWSRYMYHGLFKAE